MTVIFLLVVIGSSIWVYIDAKNIGIKPGKIESGKMTGLDSMGPVEWLAGSLLLWIVFFPLYLWKRMHFKRVFGKN